MLENQYKICDCVSINVLGNITDFMFNVQKQLLSHNNFTVTLFKIVY